MRTRLIFLLVASLVLFRASGVFAQAWCLSEPGSQSFNKTGWWTAFPGTEIQFQHYWDTHPQQDAVVGIWQKHPDGADQFRRGGRAFAQRVAIIRDCPYDGWDYVAVSVYQLGEGSVRRADKRQILFVLRAGDEAGAYDVRYPGEPARTWPEARLSDGLLLFQGIDGVESWFRISGNE